MNCYRMTYELVLAIEIFYNRLRMACPLDL